MKLIVAAVWLVLLLASCGLFGDRHLDEKKFISKDITVTWYKISRITTVHDYIDVKRGGRTKNIMEANEGGLYDILIKDDTIVIQVMPHLLIYKLAARELGCYIKVDSSITDCQYMRKYNPQNTWHCEEADTSKSKTH